MFSFLELLVDALAVKAWEEKPRDKRQFWGCLWSALGLTALVVVIALVVAFQL